MNNTLYEWEMIKTFDNKIISIEFRSALKGWLSELQVEQTAKTAMWAEYQQGTNRIQLTEDGGKTWRVIYEAKSSLIEQLHYMDSKDWLLGVKSVYQQGQPRPHFKLYKSMDKGSHWEKFCELPVAHAIRGFHFFDANRGYMWTLKKIFFTSTAGKQWQLITSQADIAYTGNVYNVGSEQMIYFITHQKKQIRGINPWEKKIVNFSLPDYVEVESILAHPSQSLVYVIVKTPSKEINLLAYDNNQLILKENIPINKPEITIQAFAYRDDLINLVVSTLSFFKPYYFYVRDQQGWHQESISGKKNFEHFVYWKNHAWAVRIALLKGHRELWQRSRV
ncbi:MAG: hypothetical protein SVR94_11390 [Pseudomonadota bacterium]|nr:hypothetical protein [Pseudomonadota bacterium]